MAIRHSKEKVDSSSIKNETPVSIVLPKIIKVGDYHEFDSMAETLNELVEKGFPKVKAEEIGYCGGKGYIGVLYVGLKPSKAVIKQMLDENKIKLDEDEDN
jgi:hypothetical protein